VIADDGPAHLAQEPGDRPLPGPKLAVGIEVHTQEVKLAINAERFATA
jgi:hypothetical protein